MTVAYIAQIEKPTGVVYVGRSMKIVPVPHFFRSASALRGYLQSNLYRGSAAHYNTESHKSKTTVIMIKDVDHGLRQADAQIMSYDEFVNAPTKASPMMGNSRAFYKVQLANGQIYGVGARSTNRFGYVFGRASDLRRHITNKNLYGGHALNSHFKDAKVIEVVMHDDNVNIKEVNTYSAKDFYLASPSSRKTYNRAVSGKTYRQYA